MRLTILRCPPYAYHEPHTMGSKQLYDWLDQGEQEFTLVLRPHLGDWRDSGVVEAARALNFPLLPITTHAHAGVLPAQATLAELTSSELEITALKPAEDDKGYIVRIVDRHGRGGSGELVWRGVRFPITLHPFQISTWRLTQPGDAWQIAPCDLLERPTSKS